MEANFLCTHCGNKFYEPNYSVSFSMGSLVYKYKGQFIHCPECDKMELEFIEQEIKEYNVYFGKFHSMNDQDKKKVLRKRSKEHFDKNLKERKNYLDKNFKGKVGEVDFKQ